MEPVLLAAAVVVVLVLVTLVASRNRRDAALEPTRLGPSWQPSVADDEPRPDPEAQSARIRAVVSRTDADEHTVAEVLEIWDEYLGVLGLAPLPASHTRLVYDPYDPPVARRGSDGRAVPDRERVARDVAARTGVEEPLALEILEADAGGGPHAG